MGHPGGKQTHGRQLVVLNQLVFKTHPFGNVVDDD